MAYVITQPKLGIYLGNWMGLGFWSKLDPVGQSVAVTFDSISEAKNFIATWEFKPKDISFVEVYEDNAGIVGSIESCVNAGLDGWEV